MIGRAGKAPLKSYCESEEIPAHVAYNDRWWQACGNFGGRLGRYRRGGLIQLIQEMEGLGFEDAVKRTLEAAGEPGELPPAAPGEHLRADAEREGLDSRLRRIVRKARRGPKGGLP